MSMRTLLVKFHSEAVALTAGVPKVLNGTGTDRPDPRKSLTLSSPTALFLGGPDVSAANGIPWPANAPLSLDCTDGLYAFSVAGTTVNILEGF